MVRLKITFFLPLIMAVVPMLCNCASHKQSIHNGWVELHLKKPGAKVVKIAYSLDQFKPHNTQKIFRSTWVVSIPATEEFRYFYIVDGSVFLPSCPYREKDDFGSENCIFRPIN